MTTNVSKEKREKLIEKINLIKTYIQTAPQDENTSNLLTYISEIEKDLKSKKYGLVFEEHKEEIDEILETHVPVLTEKKDLFINNSGEMNFLIEGDNLASLKLLAKTHKGKIDMIYIDPPYNTGNKSWKYNNDYVEKDDAFKHSKFLSFMRSRLLIAKQLLSTNGIFAIAIDDYEVHTIRMLCDEIFGEDNRLSSIVIVHNPRGRNDDKYFATMHEYTLFYSLGKEAIISKFKHTEEDLDKEFPFNDHISRYGLVSFMRTGNNSDRNTRPNLYYPIYIGKNNEISLTEMFDYTPVYPINSKGIEKTWRWQKETLISKLDDILIKRKEVNIALYKKRRPEVVGGKKPKTVWYEPRYDASSHGINLIDNILNKKGSFPYPKSFFALLDILEITTNENATILDFFAGSGTTGHAVLELNKKDGGNRKFILCTNNENDICKDVTYERIKRVIEKEDYKAGFKYMRVEFIPMNNKLYYEYADELLKHIKELVELENGVNFDHNKKIAIILTEDELDEFTKNLPKECKSIYLGHDVLPTEEQEKLFKVNKIKINIIPEYYYRSLEG